MDLAFEGGGHLQKVGEFHDCQELGAETELLMVPEELHGRSCLGCVAENNLLPPKLGETWTPHTLRPTPPGVGTQADQWHLGTTANQGVQEGTTDGVVAWHSKAKVHMGADAGMQLYHHLW